MTLGYVKSPPILLSIFGLIIIAPLMAVRVKGAILLGILGSTIVGLLFGLVSYHGILRLPPSPAPTLFKLEVLKLFREPEFLTVVFVFFLLDLFDTVGTLVGIGESAGFMVNGKLPRARKALFSDATGTVVRSLMGTSTVTSYAVTSYIESASGVAEGGRTGLANIVTAAFMIASLFFYPLVKMAGEGYKVPEGLFLYPLIAPALREFRRGLYLFLY